MKRNFCRTLPLLVVAVLVLLAVPGVSHGNNSPFTGGAGVPGELHLIAAADQPTPVEGERAVEEEAFRRVRAEFSEGYPELLNATRYRAFIQLKSDYNTDVYYVVLEGGADKPSPEQVREGTDAHDEGLADDRQGELTLVAGEDQRLEITGLDEETSYDIYFHTEYGPQNNLSKLAIETDSYFAGGSGSPGDPYQIATPNHLHNVRYKQQAAYYGPLGPTESSVFVLIEDIDLGVPPYNEGKGWRPIAFYGDFNGNNHTISNLYINRPDEDYVGLFAWFRPSVYYRDARLWICGVNLENVDVTGRNYVGALVGANTGRRPVDRRPSHHDEFERTRPGRITASHAHSGSVKGEDYVGGLVGDNMGGVGVWAKYNSPADCSAGVDVEGRNFVGGLVGASGVDGLNITRRISENSRGNPSVIYNSYAEGNVTGEICVGGLVGVINSTEITYRNHNHFKDYEVYAAGDVTGKESVGGLVGRMHRGSRISNTHASGKVTSTGSDESRLWIGDGGLVGTIDRLDRPRIPVNTIEDSYATGDVTSEATHERNGVGGLIGYASGFASIRNNYATGDVSGKSPWVGGLAGKAFSINNSFATGNVTGGTDDGQYHAVGGLVGYGRSFIRNSFATGDVEGSAGGRIGGLVGHGERDITYSYARGSVTDRSGNNEYVGGLIGRHNEGRISNSFWDSEDSGMETSPGGIPKTTAELKNYATFFLAGWDFVGEDVNGEDNIWRIDESAGAPDNEGYPSLSWQGYEHRVKPLVTTGEVTETTGSAATVSSSITGLGYPDQLTQHGVVWSTEENPTTADNKTEEGGAAETGDFTSEITGLDDESVYYTRAYAQNSLGTFYGDQVEFYLGDIEQVDIAEIPGVIPPQVGEAPVNAIEDTEQYTGTVRWEPHHESFEKDTVYTATITLSSRKSHTFTGLDADFFRVAGAESVENEADSGVVTAVFPNTGFIYHTLTIGMEGRGIAQPRPGERMYKEGEEVELEATPGEGWEFKKWVVNGTDRTTSTLTLVIDADKTATAFFTEKEEEGWTILTGPDEPVAVDSPILLTFNRSFFANEIEDVIIEKNNEFIPVKVELQAEDNQLIVTPEEDYQAGAWYSLQVTLKNLNNYKMYFQTKDES